VRTSDFTLVFSASSLLPALVAYIDNKDLVSLSCTQKYAQGFFRATLGDRRVNRQVSIRFWRELENGEQGLRNIMYLGYEVIPQSLSNTNLTHLTFGYLSIQPIAPHRLPNTITHLTFGPQFNQPIGEGVLPQSITHLTFGIWFRQKN
jgi:hypothetical protein